MNLNESQWEYYRKLQRNPRQEIHQWENVVVLINKLWNNRKHISIILVYKYASIRVFIYWPLPRVPGTQLRNLVISEVIRALEASFVPLFGLQCQFLTQAFKIPRLSLGHRNMFCSNEVTFGGLQEGAGYQKDQAVNISCIFQAHPSPLGRGEGLEIESMIHHTCSMKPL